MTIEAAIEEEAADLAGLAEGLRRQTGSQGFDRLIDEIGRIPHKARSAPKAEEALEGAAFELRRRWLDLADAATHRSYRSPLAEQTLETPTRLFENFGYERELQPAALEARCAAFFGPPPEGWRAEHVLFSSGQAAMTASLHLAERLAPDRKRPLKVIHAGAYFETSELIAMLAPRFRKMATGRAALSASWADADIVLIEPVFYEERFATVSSSKLVERLAGAEPILIFDDTLTGGSLDIAPDLEALDKAAPRAVIRVVSGLKLFQAGLELANVGVASLYARRAGDDAEVMKRLRALLGLSLRFADVASLEAPWFLDHDYTRRYSDRVFEHNRTLATALSAHARSFASVSHPCVDTEGGVAPFCILRLPSPALDAYERLAHRIQQAALRDDILFERGGSFGFRGHRYDVVSPKNAPPFLRVAMGRRGGCSFRRVISLLKRI